MAADEIISKAKTAGEVRDDFMATCRALADFWEYHRGEGEDWIEPGTLINDCSLHEMLYREDLRGVWHKHGR